MNVLGNGTICAKEHIKNAYEIEIMNIFLPINFTIMTLYILDAEGSSQIILPTQHLERTCYFDKESETVL